MGTKKVRSALCVLLVVCLGLLAIVAANGSFPIENACDPSAPKLGLVGRYHPQCEAHTQRKGPLAATYWVYKAAQFSPAGMGWCVTVDGFRLATIDVKHPKEPRPDCVRERAALHPTSWKWWEVAYGRTIQRFGITRE